MRDREPVEAPSQTRSELKHHRVVVVRRGGPEVLQVIEEDAPAPGPSEVRVEVLAAGVSAYDLMLRSGRFPGFPKPPFTPGVDIVGVVDRLGDDVTSVTEGQMVAGLMFSANGGYAELVCVPEGEIVPVPAGVDPAEAVCMAANYVTAYRVLHEDAKVEAGERILVHGAAGGVGTALLQLGKLAGLEMYGTASKHNHELVSALGATPIDYRTEDFVARIRSLTGDGVDAVFDPIGGARQLWRSHRVLRRGGRLVWFGVAASSRRGMKVIPLSLATRTALALIPDGRHVPLSRDPGTQWSRTTLAELLDLLAAGELRPLIADRIPLAEASRAHELLARGGLAGKIVLIPET